MKHYQLFKYTTNREVFVFPKFFRQTNDNEKKNVLHFVINYQNATKCKQKK